METKYTVSDLLAELHKREIVIDFVWDYDDDADLSYLDQDEFSDIDKNKVTSLFLVMRRQCGECRSMEIVDSLGGIDFIDDKWETGTMDAKRALMLEGYQGLCVKDMLEEYLRTLKELN